MLGVADLVTEMSDAYGLTVQEKYAVPLDPNLWSDDATFYAEVNKLFKVKETKKTSGSKFWKGVREAVMAQLKTQDLLLLVSRPEASELQLPLQ